MRPTGLASGTLTERSAGAAAVEGDGCLGEAATADGGEGFRTRRPPTAACGGTSPTGGEVGVGGGHSDAVGAAGDCGETSVSTDPSAACGGTSPPSGEESFTNEPEVDEDVICSQTQEIVEVTADSGVDSGLDNVADMLGPGGKEAFEIGDPAIDEEGRVAGVMPGVSCQLSVVSCTELLPATGDDERSRGAGRTTRSVGEAVSTRSVGTRSVENPRSGCEASVNGDAPPPAAAAPANGEESFTNEPEVDEDVSRSQTQEIVEITADSGVDSGLDNVADMLGPGGKEAFEIGDPAIDEEGRVAGLMPGVSCQLSVVSCTELLPATGDDERSRGAGRTTRSVGRRFHAERGNEEGRESKIPERQELRVGVAPRLMTSARASSASPHHGRRRGHLPAEWGREAELQLQAACDRDCEEDRRVLGPWLRRSGT